MKSTIAYLAASLLATILLIGCILIACLEETPNEIHERLVPKLAADLISRQDSPRIDRLPPQVQAILKAHAAEGMTFLVGAPGLKGETGIRFYSKKDHRCFLSIALYLHQSEKSYLFTGFSETDDN